MRIVAFLSVVVCLLVHSMVPAQTPGGLPPEGTVHPGEWEDMQAQVMSWPFGSTDLYDLFAEIVDHVQEYNEVWMVVNDASQQATVESALTARGVPLTNVIFYIDDVDSIWSRDYGPNYIRTPLGEGRIADTLYYVTRPNDDVVPFRLGTAQDTPMHEALLSQEGGNFQSDGHGHCFFTERLYDNNPDLTIEEIHGIYRDYVGCEESTAVYDIPDEGTGHIDMFAKLVNPTTWLVGEYPEGDPNRQVLEDNATLLGSLIAHDGSPYQVIRIPMPTTSPTTLTVDYGDIKPAYDETKAGDATAAGEIWRTHTNSTIADEMVLVPTYGKGTDAEAMEIYEAAMPDHIIVGVDSEAIIPLNGAIHCVTMQVPAFPPYEGLAYHSIQGLAETTGNGDGAIDPGETWEFSVVLDNRGTSQADAASARIALNAATPAGAVLIRDSAGFGSIPGGATAPSEVAYRVALDGSYPCGEPLVFDLVDVTSSLGPNPDQPHGFSLVVGDETVTTSFADDMEAGAGGWTHTPVGGGDDLWHQQSDPGCFPASSPTTSWAFVDGGTCDFDTGGTPAADLTSETIAGITADSKLYFDYWRETETCIRLSFIPDADIFTVKVSDDGFATSTTLLELSCKNPSHAQWLSDGPYDLSAWAGGSIQVRFGFDSTGAGGNDWRGIGVDDVLVEGRTYACSSFSSPLPGEVPLSAQAGGEPVRVDRSGDDLVVTWDPSCNAGVDTDYAVYRGTLSALRGGTWDHQPVVCTDSGADRTETFAAGGDSYWFVVVPHDGAWEGSHGTGATGERPASSGACFPAGGGTCQ